MSEEQGQPTRRFWGILGQVENIENLQVREGDSLSVTVDGITYNFSGCAVMAFQADLACFREVQREYQEARLRAAIVQHESWHFDHEHPIAPMAEGRYYRTPGRVLRDGRSRWDETGRGREDYQEGQRQASEAMVAAARSLRQLLDAISPAGPASMRGVMGEISTAMQRLGEAASEIELRTRERRTGTAGTVRFGHHPGRFALQRRAAIGGWITLRGRDSYPTASHAVDDFDRLSEGGQEVRIVDLVLRCVVFPSGLEGEKF